MKSDLWTVLEIITVVPRNWLLFAVVAASCGSREHNLWPPQLAFGSSQLEKPGSLYDHTNLSIEILAPLVVVNRRLPVPAVSFSLKKKSPSIFIWWWICHRQVLKILASSVSSCTPHSNRLNLVRISFAIWSSPFEWTSPLCNLHYWLPTSRLNRETSWRSQNFDCVMLRSPRIYLMMIPGIATTFILSWASHGISRFMTVPLSDGVAGPSYCC